MKHRFTLVMIVMTATIFLSLKHHNGEKNSGQAPIGRTGAPGESTCGSCHTGGGYSGEMTFDWGEKSDLSYVPGETYTITFTGDYDAPRYGFSITVLDEDDQPAGQFSLLDDDNTSFATGSNGRQYVGQKNAGSLNTWSFEWTAPQESVGIVTFYYVINATNNNNATSGDLAETGSTTIAPFETTETYTLVLKSEPEEAGVLTGAGTYEAGEVVLITASANEGFVFDNWSDADGIVSNDAEFEYTMPEGDKELTAHFSEHDETSVGDTDSREIRVFPNPASDKFIIETGTSAQHIIIADVMGKVVWQSSVSSDRYHIESHGWESGIYIIKAETTAGVITNKLLIQNR